MATEKRLIDANELKCFVCETCNAVNSDEPCEPSDCRCMLLIDEMPTVDAVEVVHGRWIGREEKLWNLDIPIVTMWECSVCGMSGGYYEYNYCPNCGAKMDGVNEDD